MTTSLVRKQFQIPARRQLVADTGAISIVLPVPTVAVPERQALGDAATAAKRFLVQLLRRRPRRASPSSAVHDVVYRNDDGGAGDDGGWD